MLPENRDAAAVFVAVQTQWRVSGMGRRTGLDYPAVQMVMTLKGIEDQRDVFDRIQVMEREILNIDGEKASNTYAP